MDTVKLIEEHFYVSLLPDTIRDNTSFDQRCCHESTSPCQPKENQWQEAWGLKRGGAWDRSPLSQGIPGCFWLKAISPLLPPFPPPAFPRCPLSMPHLPSFGVPDQQYAICSRFLQCLWLDDLLWETPAILVTLQFIHFKQKCPKIFKNKKFFNSCKLEQSRFTKFGRKQEASS